MRWQPYTEDVLELLPEICRSDRHIWRARCPLICFEVVERHFPDRVMRQFGMEQAIPDVCDTGDSLHRMDRRGTKPKNYETVHAIHVEEWRQRERYVVSAPEIIGPNMPSNIYMGWYRRITKLSISPASTDALLAQAIAHMHLRCSQDLANISDYPGEAGLVIALDTLRDTVSCCQEVMERVGMSHMLDIQAAQQSQPQPVVPSRQPRVRGRGRGRGRVPPESSPPHPPPSPSTFDPSPYPTDPPFPHDPPFHPSPLFISDMSSSSSSVSRLTSPPIRAAYHRRRQNTRRVDLQIHSIAEGDEAGMGSSNKKQRED